MANKKSTSNKGNAPQMHNGHISSNKKARHDYQIIEKFEAGLVLTGSEVKTLRLGRATITDGHVIVDKNGEIWIDNISIPPYPNAANTKFANHEERRKRKLLLHKREIEKIVKGIQTKGQSTVPLGLYFKHGRAKLELALGTGKKLHDKRESIKKRDIERNENRKMKSF